MTMKFDQTTPKLTSDQERNKRLAERVLNEIVGGGNFAVVDDLVHPRFVNHEAGPRTPVGPDGLKMTVEWLRAAFNDLHYEIKDEIAEGDKVVLRVISAGHHTGEFIGFQPTGKSFEVEQIHIYRIEDGRIIEHWSSRDDLAQGMQLGFIPAGASASLGIEDRPTPGPIPGRRLAKLADVPVGGGIVLATEHVVVAQPRAGVYSAFSSTCTHMGCTVGRVEDGLIKCPCHGSEFRAEDGSVAHGPATRALPQVGVRLEGGDLVVV
jgi:predicted ester cyclase/nitrite reductase/ring-hydroxylating ferredoxin subunit